MQVSGKTLLNSAESILRDRNRDPKGQTSIGASEASKLENTESMSTSGMEARILKLQEALKSVQNDYSREQTRYSFLSEKPSSIQNELEYNGQPLFPELHEGKSITDLQGQVGSRMNELVISLKSIQVEMENLYALHFTSEPNVNGVNVESLLKSNPMKDISPDRVAKLTR